LLGAVATQLGRPGWASKPVGGRGGIVMGGHSRQCQSLWPTRRTCLSYQRVGVIRGWLFGRVGDQRLNKDVPELSARLVTPPTRPPLRATPPGHRPQVRRAPAPVAGRWALAGLGPGLEARAWAVELAINCQPNKETHHWLRPSIPRPIGPFEDEPNYCERQKKKTTRLQQTCEHN